ncbi:MAG: hypothetical protein AAF702_19130, partial [Chloroflexota bacterium]
RQILVPFRTPFFPLLGAERLFYTTFFSFGHAPMLDLFFLCPNSQTQGPLCSPAGSPLGGLGGYHPQTYFTTIGKKITF